MVGRKMAPGESTISSPSNLPLPLLHRLERLAQLPENWDSYSARRITGKAIEKARKVLLNICSTAGIEFALRAFIAPRPDGGLQIEWDNGAGKELVLEVPPEGRPMRFLWAAPQPSGESRETSGSLRDAKELYDLLRSYGA